METLLAVLAELFWHVAWILTLGYKGRKPPRVDFGDAGFRDEPANPQGDKVRS